MNWVNEFRMVATYAWADPEGGGAGGLDAPWKITSDYYKVSFEILVPTPLKKQLDPSGSWV